MARVASLMCVWRLMFSAPRRQVGDSGSGRAADLRCRETRLHTDTVPRASRDP